MCVAADSLLCVAACVCSLLCVAADSLEREKKGRGEREVLLWSVVLSTRGIQERWLGGQGRLVE